MPAKPTARIEAFRSGTFTPMSGDPVSYTAADLAGAADVYDRETAPAPIVVGHPATDAPAYGWVRSFSYDATADRLYADVEDIEPAFAEGVRAGRYKKVSMSFFAPRSSANPVPGSWYPKHIGFLGAAAPAVSGLRNVQFAADDGSVTFTADFGDPGFEQTAGILRMLRDFMIEKFGLEAADKALPSYQIEWLSETEAKPSPAFSVPAPKQEPSLTTPSDPAFAAREADVAAREQRLNARMRDIAHADNVSFAEGLVTAGKLLPASKDKAVAILDALPEATTVSFAAGETAVPVAQAIRDLLTAQPKTVDFGRSELPAGVTSATASFASDGRQVDAEGLEAHAKAVAYQREHPGTAYLDAIRAVS